MKIAATLILSASLLLTTAVTHAQESSPVELKLPDDLADNLAESPSKTGVAYEEYRVGGRLERVTVTHKNGITEVYKNNRGDTLWNAQENEIGEIPNMREWVIGTW